MRIEIICTGDEVLTGKITNTNFSYMAQKLEDVGLSVHWGTTVGDDRDALLARSIWPEPAPTLSSSTAASARPSMTCRRKSPRKQPESNWSCTRIG